MNYEEMRDFEINSLVFRLMMKYEPMHCHGGFIYHPIIGGEYNPCNNPADAWPIIFENEIKLDPRPSHEKLPWMASFEDRCYSVHPNPLRAAMICFLKMKDM